MAGGNPPEPGCVAYEGRGALYLNLTNRCPNDCAFCAKGDDYLLWGYNQRLAREPTFEETTRAVGDPSRFGEVVFCGYGEPTCRAELVIRTAAWLRENGARRVRLNTNGLADRACGRDILPDLAGNVDAVSVSLNAQDDETYQRICRPKVPEAHAAVLDFIGRASRLIPEVTATVVNYPGVDTEACRRLAADLGAGFRVRG